MPNKSVRFTSMRLSTRAIDLISEMAGELSISKTSVMELAIRKMFVYHRANFCLPDETVKGEEDV